jgi:hypothetical protein
MITIKLGNTIPEARQERIEKAMDECSSLELYDWGIVRGRQTTIYGANEDLQKELISIIRDTI